LEKGRGVRKKEWKVVITFKTTTGAMGMEKLCKEEGISGRLIPVPRQITAGCGLAWCDKLESREVLEKVMSVHNLVYENIYEMEI
jgi:hypothetical protein